MARRLVKYLGSAGFAQITILVWLVLILTWVLPLQFQVMSSEWPQHVVYRTPPFIAVYVALSVSLVLCTARRLVSLPRRLSLTARQASGKPVLIEMPFDERRARRVLAREGFRRIDAGEEHAWALRNPFGPLGSLLLHGGIAIVMAGVVLAGSLGATFIGRARVTEGDAFDGAPAAYFETAHGADTVGKRGRPGFVVDAVDAAGVPGLPPDRLVVTARRPGSSPAAFSAGLPWFYSPTTMVAVEDFSYTPVLSLIPSGAVEPAARLAPALARGRDGVEESVQADVRGERYRVSLSLDAGGREVFAAVSRRQAGGGWRIESEGATLTAGSNLKLGSVWVRLEDIRPNVVVRVTRMPAAPVIGLGILVAVAGAVVRLVFPRTEVSMRALNGTTAVSVSIDVYRDGTRLQLRLARAWHEEVAA